MNKNVTNYEWVDNETFLVNFESAPTTENFELDGVTEEVVVEFHKDENKWVVDIQYYDKDGGYIDHDIDALSDYEKGQYIAIASSYLS